MSFRLIKNMQIGFVGILSQILIPFMIFFGSTGVVLQKLQDQLQASLFFVLIDVWFFAFGAGLIIIMNMVSFILGKHRRRTWGYWPAQLLITLIIFISMFCIILVISGVVRWHAIKLLSGLVSG